MLSLSSSMVRSNCCVFKCSTPLRCVVDRGIPNSFIWFAGDSPSSLNEHGDGVPSAKAQGSDSAGGSACLHGIEKGR